MRLATLGDAALVNMGQAPAGEFYNIEGVGLPLVAGAGDFGDLSPAPSRFTSISPRSTKPGDIILCVRATIGDLNLADREYCLGRGVAGLRTKPDVCDARYLWWALHNSKADLASRGRGATFKQVTRKDIESLPLRLPPLDEQRRIAAILDQSDALRRKRLQACKRLNQLSRAVFSEMFGDLSILPRTHSFGEVAAIQQSLVDPKLPEFQSALHVSPEHLVSGSGSVNWENVRTAKEDSVISGKNQFWSEDILYSKIRPYLNKVAIADRAGICSADMYVVRSLPRKSTTQFLKYLLMGDDFLSYAATCSNRANIPKLNRRELEGYRFHCPPLEAQQEFNSRLNSLDSILRAYTKAADVSSSLFASLQHRAFRGEL